ncbi:MAG: dTDP-4-dehydrorhamnose 3,5-epimerase [bacterium]|nr:dTDP-4-dehydrorhamnose 3,5-epimerase [bacterium]
MKIESEHLNGLYVLAPEVFEDERGFFMETFRVDQFKELGLPHEFVQDNHSRSQKGVLRGLHFQWEPPMAKLMRVTYGSAFLVAVDIRKGSPTQGEWFGMEVSDKNKKQIFAPAGFARGFYTISDFAEIQYKCTGVYGGKENESGFLWNDPAIGIEWPCENPTLSEKDKNAQTMAQWMATPEADYFKY